MFVDRVEAHRHFSSNPFRHFRSLQSFTVCFPSQKWLNSTKSRPLIYNVMKDMETECKSMKKAHPEWTVGKWGTVAWNDNKDGLVMMDDKGAL